VDEPPPPVRQASRFEPIREDEVSAFKQALASGISDEMAAPKEKLIKSWKHRPIPRADFADTEFQDPSGKSKNTARANTRRPPDFQDTEVAEKAEKVSPLSSTQYGDLN
jgi:hypothetical protein